MRLAGLNTNDCVNGQGVCTSLWVQGCPHRCPGCHNPETWDFKGGYEIESQEIIDKIIRAISANGITRNFSILGGEPLCPENLPFVEEVIIKIRDSYPNIDIFLWTGYTLEYLKEQKEQRIENILSQIDVLIDGPFILAQRNITLPLRGSENQRVLYKGIDF